MKVHIGKYKNFVGPYQIAQKLLFWMDKDDDRVHNFGTWLADDKNGDDSWLTKICMWIDKHRHRKVKVKLHKYDTWSMDSTLAIIILPMLKQLKVQKMGSPAVDDVDVPWYLASHINPGANSWDTDQAWHKRWDHVMDELVWTFEQLQPDADWESRYHVCGYDAEGMRKHQDRINNGLRLFGKYYQGLWS